jgi:predicted RNase H-like nuclease (RuvC/YqgF family)
MDDTMTRLGITSSYRVSEAQAEWAPLTTSASLTINDETGESIDILKEIANLREENKKLRQRLDQMESTIEELKNWKEV